MFQKDGFIAAGTLKATLHDVDLNPYLDVNTASFGEPFDDDVVVQRVNLAQPFTLKPNQVVDVTGFWNATDNALHAYALGSGIQDQNITLTTDWAGWGETLTDSTRYTVRAAITLKEPWHTTTTDSINPKDYDYDFQNYIANALYWPQIAVAITGDVNGDGMVTSADITALYSSILAGDNSDIVNGDQNGDGEINSADITMVYAIMLDIPYDKLMLMQ